MSSDEEEAVDVASEQAADPANESARRRAVSTWAIGIGSTAATALLVTVVVKLIGRIAGIGDLIAIATPVVAVLTMLLAVATTALKQPKAAVVCIALMLGCVWTVVQPRVPRNREAPSRPVTVAAVNMRFDSADAAGGVADVLARQADVLVVAELTRPVARRIGEAYPFSELRWGNSFGEGVFSTVPLERMDDPSGLGVQAIAVRVAALDPFVLLAVHMPCPVFDYSGMSDTISLTDHRRAIERLARLAERTDGPVVIAGDLNLSDRTHAYSLLADGRVDVARAGAWADTTFHRGLWWSLLRLRIDYLFVSETWCAADSVTFDITGSDHSGLVADVGPCPHRRVAVDTLRPAGVSST